MPRHIAWFFRRRTRRSSYLRFAVGLVLLAGALACEPLLLGPSRYGEVYVTIATASGEVVPDVPIVLYTGARPIEYARTDASGSFLFQRVPADNYGVLGEMPAGMCNPDGSRTLVTDDLDVVPGERRLVPFTIRPCVPASATPVRAAP
jgi:hypothetical protein